MIELSGTLIKVFARVRTTMFMMIKKFCHPLVRSQSSDPIRICKSGLFHSKGLQQNTSKCMSNLYGLFSKLWASLGCRLYIVSRSTTSVVTSHSPSGVFFCLGFRMTRRFVCGGSCGRSSVRPAVSSSALALHTDLTRTRSVHVMQEKRGEIHSKHALKKCHEDLKQKRSIGFCCVQKKKQLRMYNRCGSTARRCTFADSIKPWIPVEL